jgi:hypothetical protein
MATTYYKFINPTQIGSPSVRDVKLICGLNYYISETNIIISNSSCMDEFTDKTIQLNIGLDVTINCG